MLKTGKGEFTAPVAVRVPLRLLLVGAVAIVIAFFVGTQVLGVLYSIFFPPEPPLPVNLSLISHSSEDFGIDDWLYRSDQDVCDIVKYYVDNGGNCRIVPGWCGTQSAGGVTSPGADNPNQNVAHCAAEAEFSIFALRWQVVVATGSTAADPSQFRVNREIFWTGAVPPISNPQQ